MMRFPATFVLIEHERLGNILFDTGYGQNFFEETRHFPASLYRNITPVTLNDEDTALAQLARLGISPDSIRFIIISHFHADHLGGLRDFPKARFIASRAAYASVKGIRGIRAVKKAFLPGMLPADFASRLDFLEEVSAGVQAPFGSFASGFDLLGDGSIMAVALPGHAAGQIGIRLMDQDGVDWFFIADAAWHERTYKEMRLPAPVTRFIMHSWRDFTESLAKVNEVYREEPLLRIIPCHCEDTFARFGHREIAEDVVG